MLASIPTGLMPFPAGDSSPVTCCHSDLSLSSVTCPFELSMSGVGFSTHTATHNPMAVSPSLSSLTSTAEQLAQPQAPPPRHGSRSWRLRLRLRCTHIYFSLSSRLPDREAWPRTMFYSLHGGRRWDCEPGRLTEPSPCLRDLAYSF